MPYRSGARGDWIKVKCVKRESFFIIGYEGHGLRRISRLLLGAYQGDKIVYVGRVGTGFTDREASELRQFDGSYQAAEVQSRTKPPKRRIGSSQR
jgi:bifunctional non-homologous end joining protein LigD